MTDNKDITARHWVDRDSFGDLTLWTGDRDNPTAVVAMWELSAIERRGGRTPGVLWDAVVAQLAGGEGGDKTPTDNTPRVRFARGCVAVYRPHPVVNPWHCYNTETGEFIEARTEQQMATWTWHEVLAEVPAAVAGEQRA